MNKKTQDRIRLFDDKQQTIEKFKKGELAYKETPLGGCMTTEPCDKKPLRSLSACLNCEKAIIKQSKLTKIILIQEDFINQLNKDSIEYRAEAEELKNLAMSPLSVEFSNIPIFQLLTRGMKCCLKAGISSVKAIDCFFPHLTVT